MTWTLGYFIIQIVAGILGGHAAATLAKEHSFGVLGHTLTGAIGGAVSGYFLQTKIGSVATIDGGIEEIADPVTQWMMQTLGGLTAGAALTLAVGFLKHSIEQHKTGKP